MKRFGFAAVLGAPNAGKSTLINAMAGGKVSIVSSKVQTTRCLVRGIAVRGDSQIVFIDTPGIFRPNRRLERAMVAAAWQGGMEADVICLVADASRSKICADTRGIVERLAAQQRDNDNRSCLLILNKTDKTPKERLLALAAELNAQASFAATFMISALKEEGTADILDWLAARLPEGDWHYEPDVMSDMPMRLLAAEITREKLFRALHEELPHALAVETEEWEQFDNGSIRIGQAIYVARASHKAIVIGKGGSQLKQIGQASREELEEILGTRVHLNLFVKVQENWADDPEKYGMWGLDFSA